MIYQKFSKRQLLAMSWWSRPRFKNRDAIICDGSVRSGKTVCMADGFLLWSMRTFNGQNFAICGKTVESLRRNVILSLPDWVGGVLDIQERRSENKLIVSDGEGHENTYFLFGGRDESSYMLIQGITLAGVLLDEVALMPRSFVEQAIARCSVAGSKIWFNCNPGGPEHWFYKEWVLKAKERNALHLHFTMADNLALAPEIRARYERLYSGVFYRRYVLGEWCLAEGLVYEFNQKMSVVTEIPERGRYYISVDYGTLNPFSAGLWCLEDGVATRIQEYYYSGRSKSALKTDEEYYQELENLAGDLDVEYVVVDPSAASFIETIRRHGRFSVRKAKNDVLSGIRLVSVLLRARRLLFHESCADSIREFSLYAWDDKEGKAEVDKPLKINDHAMDDIRYFCSTVLRRELRHIPEMKGLSTDDS